MSGQNISELSKRIGSLTQKALDIANEAGCPESIFPAGELLKQRHLDNVNLLIIGGPNSGKSTVINRLLGSSILPTSALPSNGQFILRSVASEANQGFHVSKADASGSAAFDGKIQKLGEFLASETHAGKIEVLVYNKWLLSQKLTIEEAKSIDLKDSEASEFAKAYLHGPDCVLLLLDALRPFRRPEALFLRACVSYELPVIVAVAKSDCIQDVTELDEVLRYVREHVHAYSASIPVVALGLGSDATVGLDELRSDVEAVVVSDIGHVRLNQVANSLLIGLSTITAAAEAGLAAQSQSEQEREKHRQQCREEIGSQELIWLRIEQELDKRRHALTDCLCDELGKRRDSTLKTVERELDKASDVKTWWERDMPFRLEEEFTRLSGDIAGRFSRQLADDLKWLQEELRRQFQYSLEFGGDSDVPIGRPTFDRKDIHLANTQRLRILVRLGHAGVVLTTGILFATSHIGGIVLTSSIGAGLLSEQMLRWNTNRDQSVARAELSGLIRKAEVNYAAAVSEKLRESYGAVIAKLKHHQTLWQQTQLQAISLSAPSGTIVVPQWTSIIDRSASLMAEVKSCMSVE